MAIALRPRKEQFQLIEARLVMGTFQQDIGVEPGSGRPAQYPIGAGSSGSVVYVIALSSVAAVGGFLFGFDSGVINGAVDALSGAFGTQSSGTGFAVASVLLGCAAGAFLAGTLADFMGRRPTMLLNAVFFLISAFATGAASSAGIFIAARILGGLAIGAASVLAPMYISEVAPSRLRGRLSSLQQLAIVLGLFGAFLSNYLIAWAAGGPSATFWLGMPAWRWMFWMEAVPAAVFLVGVCLIPESPRFLVAHGKRERALRVFAHISGDAEHAEELVRQVQESLRGEHRPRLSDLIERGGRVAPVVWVGMGLAAFQQFVGINVIFYYGAVLWKAAGATEEHALQINLLTGLVNILATIPAIMLVDRLGRKPLLLAGSIGMALTLGTLAVVFANAGVGEDGKPALTNAAAVIGLVAANLYIVAFGVSWGPVLWVLLGEMFPNRLRGAALAVSGATNWVANFAVTLTFPPMLKGAGLAGAYGLYAAAALLSLFFVWSAVRETKGKTLEQM
jgi:SP family sugar:H+ symporter-like MFS transporter